MLTLSLANDYQLFDPTDPDEEDANPRAALDRWRAYWLGNTNLPMAPDLQLFPAIASTGKLKVPWSRRAGRSDAGTGGRGYACDRVRSHL
jgi:hypothetical protein